MTQRQIPPSAWAQLLLLALIWAGSFPSNRIALDGFGVATVVALRVGIGALVMWGVVLARGLRIPHQPKVWAKFLVMGCFTSALPFGLIVWGQSHIDSGLAAILNASTAILGVTVAALVFRDERLGFRKGLGVAAGFLGVAVTLGFHRLMAFDPASLGQLAVLGAATSYAVGGSLARVLSAKTAPEVSAAGMLSGAALLAVPVALWIDRGEIHASAREWSAILYLAVVATGFAYLLYFRLIALAGAGNTSLVTLLVAPLAIVLGAVIFGEALPLRAWAGFFLIAAGLVTIDGRVFALGRARKPGDETA